MALMALGLFVFDAQKTVAPQSINRQSGFDYASAKPIGSAPFYQFMGEGAESLSLSGDLYPSFTGGKFNLTILRNMAKTGKAYILMTGYGEVLGHYIIQSLMESQSQFFNDGAAQKISFSLELKRYTHRRDERLANLSDQVYQVVDAGNV